MSASMTWTAEMQFDDDMVSQRDLDVLWRIQEMRMRQTEVARSLRISNSRIWQIYHRALKKQKAGLI